MGRKIRAYYVMCEPGDSTHYEFILTESIKNLDYIIIAKGEDGAPFSTYAYREDSIRQFMAEYPGITGWLESEYQQKVDENLILKNPFIGYIAGHSQCNVWTALAAIVVAYSFLEDI